MDEQNQIAAPVADETTTTEATPAPQDAPAAEAPPAAPPVDTTPAWVRALDEADPKELRRHPRFAGVLGAEMDRLKRTWETDAQRQHQERASKDAEARLLELARTDPDAFAERYLTDHERSRIQSDMDALRKNARSEIAQMVGRAFQGVPEWVEFSEREYEEMAQALQGKSEDEVIAVWNAKALDLVAEKRATKRFDERFQKWRETELAKEREAIRQEEAQKLRTEVPSPDMSRPRRTASALHPLYQRLVDTPVGPEYDAAYERWQSAGRPTTS